MKLIVAVMTTFILTLVIGAFIMGEHLEQIALQCGVR